MSGSGENPLQQTNGATGNVNELVLLGNNDEQNKDLLSGDKSNQREDGSPLAGGGLKSKEEELKPKVETEQKLIRDDIRKVQEKSMESLRFIADLVGEDFMEELMGFRERLKERVIAARGQVAAGSGQVQEDNVNDGLINDVNTIHDERSSNFLIGDILAPTHLKQSTRPKIKGLGSQRGGLSFSSEDDKSERKLTKLNRSRSLLSKLKTERVPIRSQEPFSSSDSEDWGTSQSNRLTPRNRQKDTETILDRDKRRNTITYVGRRTGKGVPEPEKFDVKKDKDFQDFLVDFERYCRSEYSSDRRDWVKILGNFLGEEAKDIYDTLRETDCGYAEVIQELEKWIKLTRSMKTKDYRRKFNEAEIRGNESYYGFALRIEGLAKKVYGKGFKKPMKEKYVESISPSFANHLRQLNCNTRHMCGRSLTWEEIKEHAALQTREVVKIPEKEDLSLVMVESAEKSEGGKKFKEVWPRSAKEGMTNQDTSIQDKRPGCECQGRNQRSRQWSNTRIKQEQPDTRDQRMSISCWFCEKRGHLARDCRYKNGLCAGCGAKGHFVRECPRNQRSGYPPQVTGTNEPNRYEQNRENIRNWTRSETGQREQHRERTPEQTQLLN